MKRKRPAVGSAADAADVGAPEKQRRRWTSRYGRPQVRTFDHQTTAWTFCLYAMDYYTTPEHRPVLRLWGVTDHARGPHSICVHAHGFLPYFFVRAPPELLTDTDGTAVRRFRDRLDALLYEHDRSRTKATTWPRGQPRVLAIDVVQRESLYGFTLDGQVPFLRITLATPALFYSCRTILTTHPGVDVDGRAYVCHVLYEASVLFTLRFMIDRDVRGFSWITVPAGAYTVATAAGATSRASTTDAPPPRTTRTQLELHVADHAALEVRACDEGEWAKLPPRRVLAMDIECKSLSGHFPRASDDPVVEIAAVLSDEDGRGGVRRERGVILGLGEHADFDAAHMPEGLSAVDMHSVADERTLLEAWRDLQQDVDADIEIDYNGSKFDRAYLVERAEALGIPEASESTRLLRDRVRVQQKVVKTAAMGTQKNNDILMPGRVHLDMYKLVLRDHKLRSYTLNAACQELLGGMTKDDVHHSAIPRLADGKPADRARLARYCLKDALLPLRIDQRKLKFNMLVALARTTGVPMDVLLLRGQQIRGLSCILRQARPRSFVMPKLSRAPNEETYKGAVVIDTKTGFYCDPIVTLDVNSLYPSIMQSQNLCSSTLVLDRAVEAKLRAEDVRVYEHDGHRDVFVREHIRRGVMSETVRMTVEARKRTKARLAAAAKAGDAFLEACLDAQQDAEKRTGNSIYGAAGADTATMPCKAVARTVTYVGRQILQGMVKLVESHFTRARGYPCDVEVVAGDTDSIMMRCPGVPIDVALKLGQEAVELINAWLAAQDYAGIVIEQEKGYLRAMMLARKRYAGWTQKPKQAKRFMTLKGIAAVRRDSCPFVGELVYESLRTILSADDVKDGIARAIAHAKQQIARLMQNRIDMSQLIMSVGLSQDLHEYKVQNKASLLAAKFAQRDPNAAPRVGDRLQYVVVAGERGQKVSSRGEDPMYALEHGCKLDTHFYLEQLRSPLTQIFELVMPRVEELFDGPHTRHVVHPSRALLAAAGGNAGTLMRFVVKRETCLGCQCTLSAPDRQRGLCAHCEPTRTERTAQTREAHARAVADADAERATCLKCAGADGAPLCRNTDCKHLYLRKTTVFDVDDLARQLARLHPPRSMAADADVDMTPATPTPRSLDW